MSEVKTYRDLYEALKIDDPDTYVTIEDECTMKFHFNSSAVTMDRSNSPQMSSSWFHGESLKAVSELALTSFNEREFDEFKTFVENGYKYVQHDPENDLNEDERTVLDYLKKYYHDNNYNALTPLSKFYELIAVGTDNLSGEKAELVRAWNMLEDSRKDKIIELLAIAGDELR